MATYFDVEIRTIEQWMKNGILPFIKIGRTVRFRGADIVATLDALRRNPGRRGRMTYGRSKGRD
jgi:excisionase family DNA binding protein